MKKIKPKKLKANELSSLSNNRLNGGFYDSPISFLLRESPVDRETLKLKSFPNGCLYLDEVDDLFKLVSAIISHIKKEPNTKDFQYVAHNERGYPCAEYRGGVFEVSIRTDIGPNYYEASVGAEIVRFASLEDAVASFIECIKDNLKWRG